MLVCPNCNNKQETGKFCGVCGTAVEQVQAENQNESVPGAETPIPPPVEQSEQPVQPTQQQHENRTQQQQTSQAASSQGQETMDTVKKELGNYWSYFVEVIKNPTRAFHQSENQFINGLVTLGLYAIIFSLSIYFLGNSLMGAMGMGGFTPESLPFFAIVSRLIFFIIVLFAISFGSAFLMAKAGKSQHGFKTIIAQYGALIVPFTAINVLAMLGGIIGSVQLTLVAVILSLIFTFIFIPVLFVYEKVSEANPNGQKIYISLATIVIIGVLSLLLGDSIIINLVNQVENIFNPF